MVQEVLSCLDEASFCIDGGGIYIKVAMLDRVAMSQSPSIGDGSRIGVLVV